MIEEYLLAHRDTQYREFTKKYLPKDSQTEVIGVRIPILRKYAREIMNTKESKLFLNDLPHKYLEENLLHGYLISLEIKDINEYLIKINAFLPYVNNWLITDTIGPKIFKKYPNRSYQEIKRWLKSKKPYTVRFAVVSLMQYFLDENYHREELELIRNIKLDDYYVEMAIAWFYSVALVKQYDDTIIYLESHLLKPSIERKTIQKAIESFRISEDKKSYLRSLKNVKENK